MMVTAVRRLRGHLVAITLDDGTELQLDKRTWEESPYGVDSFLSLEQVEELCARSARDRAREKAVFLLSRRDYSQRELQQKLCREKGRYHADRQTAATEAAAYMAELGYVNDQQYAARLARVYQQQRLYPRRRSVEKLCEKGIDRDTARQAVAELDIDDEQLALEFLQKRRYTVPYTREEAEKQMAALARYGFSAEDARRALKRRQEEDEYGD